MTTKQCPKCGEIKALSEFYRNKNHQDGRDRWCKKCRTESDRRYRKANQEKIKEQQRLWRENNLERCREYGRLWRKNNPEKIKEYEHRHRGRHKKYAHRFPEKIKEKGRRYRKSNPEKLKEKRRRYRARKRAAPGDGFNEAEFITLCAGYENRCLRCGRDDVSLTADHIVPLSIGGADCIENIQPLCLSCNSIKGTKPTDYRTRPPLLLQGRLFDLLPEEANFVL